MGDPTTDLIRDLDDPTKFRRVEKVAVFKPHSRLLQLADGTKQRIDVTAADIADIAAEINRAFGETGTPVRLTLGHVKQDPNYPEHLQPKVVGFAKNYRAETVSRPAGTFLAVTHDEYIRRDVSDEVLRQYPFRSPEYDPSTKRFGGVALLTRDPWLDLGAVYVYSADAKFVHYSGDRPMADANDDKPTPDEEAQYAKIAKYFKTKYSKLAAYMDDPSSTNVVPPGESSPTGYQKAPEYTALEADNLRLTVERELDQLAYQGVRFDRGVELPKLVAMTADGRKTHVAYMKTHYGRTPTGGGMIPIADDAARPAAPGEREKPLAPAELPKVLAYQKGGLPYEAAVARVLGERK